MIVSKDNKQFKLWKKLKTKKFRDLTKSFLVYGDHLIAQAKKHHTIIEMITSNPDKEGILIDSELMLELNYTETPFDSIAVCKVSEDKIESSHILALDDVQDPANMGALIRSASAFGYMHILISNKSADVYNEKTIRASQGAIFDVTHERGNLVELIEKYKVLGYHVMAADAHETKKSMITLDKIVLVLGNEGAGISTEVKSLSDQLITIKTINVESLNVAVAGSILMYEYGGHK